MLNFNPFIHDCTSLFSEDKEVILEKLSPALSLCAEAGIPPLHYRRLTLSENLLTAIAQLPDTPIHDYLFNKIDNKLPYRGASTHIRDSVNKSLSRTIQFNCLLPIYSNIPPWAIPPPNITRNLTKLPKNSTSNTIYNTHLQETIDSFPNALVCYTDGSKLENRVGGAYTIGEKQYSFRLRNVV